MTRVERAPLERRLDRAVTEEQHCLLVTTHAREETPFVRACRASLAEAVQEIAEVHELMGGVVRDPEIKRRKRLTSSA